MELIKVSEGTKIYNEGKMTEVVAVDHVTFSLNQGDMAVVTGPSGSGKTTLLHMLGGLEPLTSGGYWFDGNNVLEMNSRTLARLRGTEIAIILQDYGLLPHEDVLTNVCLPQMIAGTHNNKTIQEAKKNLREIGLDGLARKTVMHLSGGQKQRVAIARALTMNAKLILADEPTGALDSENTKQLMKLFQTINEEKGTAVLIATHDPLVVSACPIKYQITDGKLTRIDD